MGHGDLTNSRALIGFGAVLGHRYSPHDLSGEEKNTRLAESRTLVASDVEQRSQAGHGKMPTGMDGGRHGCTHAGDRESPAA